MDRTENMQAYVDNLKERIRLHGEFQNCEDQRIEMMITAVEEPEWCKDFDLDSLEFWKQFAVGQMEYGRECVSEIMEKAPGLLNDDLIGPIVKTIMGGWEYGKRFLTKLNKKVASVN